MMKLIIVVSSTAQIEMFNTLIKRLKNFEIKIINTGIPFNNKMEDLLIKYNIPFETIKKFNLRCAKEVLSKEKPNILLTGNDQMFMELLFIRASNSMDIPSLTIQDGILSSRNEKTSNLKNINNFFKLPLNFLNLFLRKKIPLRYLLEFSLYLIMNHNIRYGHGESTKIAVFGEETKRLLISEGVSPDKIEITGSSKFDQLYYYKNCPKSNIFHKYNINPKKKVVLIITEYFVESNKWTKIQRKEFICSIIDAISNMDDIHLIIKLHPPYENKEDYIQITKNIKNIPITIFIYENLHEIITICDVAISVSSTAILEAMALNKPVIILNLFKQNRPLDFKDKGVIYVDKKELIYPAINNLFNNNEYIDKNKMKQFVTSQVYKIDGKSSERIADLVMEITKELNS